MSYKLFFCILFLSVNITNATLISGTDTISSVSSSFDFSNPDTMKAYDIMYALVSGGSVGAVIESRNLHSIIDMGVGELSNVTCAPESGYTDAIGNPNPTHVFCVITSENKYAKFKITYMPTIPKMKIDWVYQNNGSRQF
jgi:hypothetical protein